MSETDARRARRGTVALFAASAALAVVGVTLLLPGPGTEHPAQSGTPTTPPRAAAASDVPAGAEADGKAPAAPSPSAPPADPPDTTQPLPEPIRKAARDFTVAWASHDARPGRDASYDDASRRAAAHADGDLAQSLRTHTGGSAGGRQWGIWTEQQVLVSAEVLSVALPDGAPAPTSDSGFARVVYRVTEQPATGKAVVSERHVALELRRGADGVWRVVRLPDA